jgi:hypothetical protein
MKLPTSACLKCGDRLDAVTATHDGDIPEPGDITICLRCGHQMALTRGLRLRELTKRERRNQANNQWTKFVEQQRRIIMEKHKH